MVLRIEDIASLLDEEIGRTEEDVKVNVIVPWLELLGHTRLKFEHDKNDILIRHGDFIVVIETKKLGIELSSYTDQLERYVALRRADLAILTNGQDFLFFSPFWRKKTFRETMILATNREHLADTEISKLISDIMSHDSIANDCAKGAIEKRERDVDLVNKEIYGQMNIFKSENAQFEKQIADMRKEMDTLTRKVIDNNRNIQNLSRVKLINILCWYNFNQSRNHAGSSIPVVNNEEITVTEEAFPNEKLTQEDLVKYILEALIKSGGKARKSTVEKYIYSKFETLFKQKYYQEMVSHGIPRWQHNIAWSKEHAKQRGLVKPPSESGHGVWELTDKGRKAASC